MAKPLGGRGQKAPYETVQVRCPKPIKNEVETLIAKYRESVLSGESESERHSLDTKYEDCLKLVFEFLEAHGLTEQLEDRTPRMYRLKQFVRWLESRSK
jgi:hypothetical protein